MKYIKKTLKIVLTIVLALVLVSLGFLWVDSNKTAYLKVKNNPTFISDSYILANVNIVPMLIDTVYKNKSVYIKNGNIESISTSLSIKNVEVIDCKNMFLSPGLIDMHVHVWDKQELGLYLANGVTAVRNLWGIPMHLRIKRELENNEIIGPTFLTSSPKLTGKNDLGDDKVQVDSPEMARELVKNYKQRGYNFIKTYAGLPKDIFEAVIKQSVKSNISIISHPSFELPYNTNFHSSIATIEHAEDIVQQPLKYKLDSVKLKLVINEFVNSEQTFSPTLTGYHKIAEILNEGSIILESDQVKYINPLLKKVDSEAQVNRWVFEKENDNSVVKRINDQHLFHLYIIRRMHEKGVNIVCSTDSGIGFTAPGFSIHEELAFYKQAGMNNFEALKTATINPSIAHKEFSKLGSIDINKQANLILTINNPLESLETLKNPEWVMVNGHLINSQSLKMFNQKAFNRKNMVVTALRYIEYLIVEK